MGASSGWNLVARRPPRVRAVPKGSVHTSVRRTRVPGRALRQCVVEHPQVARTEVRAQSAG